MDEQTYREQALQFLEKEDRFACNAFPCLGDDNGHGFDEHYVYHVAWAVRKINEVNPKIHYDISSSLHLCTTLAATIPTKFLDYRKPNLQVQNLLVGHMTLA